MLTIEQKRKFCELNGQLSPENLSCDGECSKSEIRAREHSIMKNWRALEEECGITLSPSDHCLWDWWDEIQAEDERILAELQKLALVGWEVTSENVIAHESRCAYIQHWGDDKPFLVYSGMRWDLKWANTHGYPNDKGGKEKLGETETQEDAIQMAEDYLNSLSIEDLKHGLTYYVEARMEKVLKMRA